MTQSSKYPPCSKSQRWTYRKKSLEVFITVFSQVLPLGTHLSFSLDMKCSLDDTFVTQVLEILVTLHLIKVLQSLLIHSSFPRDVSDKVNKVCDWDISPMVKIGVKCLLLYSTENLFYMIRRQISHSLNMVTRV